MTAKRVLMRPQVLRPGARAFTCYVTSVARGTLRLKANIFLRPYQQKLQNLK